MNEVILKKKKKKNDKQEKVCTAESGVFIYVDIPATMRGKHPASIAVSF